MTERMAPGMSTLRSPVYGASLTSLIPKRTIPITIASPRNATRHERYVVIKPPMSGPTAAAIAADAPTIA